MNEQHTQQQSRRFGFFRVPDPSRWASISDSCSFAAWPHHSRGGSLIGFGYCDKFRVVDDNADTPCYEWNFEGGRAAPRHIPPSDLFE